MFSRRTMLASWTGPDNSDVKEIKGKIASKFNKNMKKKKFWRFNLFPFTWSDPMKNPRNKRREEVSNF